MVIQTKLVIQAKYPPRIVRERRRVELWCPHGGGEIAFAPALTAPDTYADIGSKILALGQRIPTGDEAASQLYVAYCGPDEVRGADEYVRIRSLMKNDWFWVYNVEDWVAEGLYVVQDPQAKGMAMKLDVPTLERRLVGGKTISGVKFSKDGTVRFAPKETYRLREQSVEEFAENGVIIANFGVEGAKKLGKVAKTFVGYNPKVWGIETDIPRQRLPAVGDYCRGYRLDFVGSCRGGLSYGFASGVLESAPKAPRKV